MSDSITINVIQEGPTNIEVNDTGQNIYLNPISLNQGIINHSVTHQSGGSDELLHNLLGGLYGGTAGQYYHLSSGQYFNLTTGDVVRPSETGAFYPRTNPSGFIGSVDLTGYATVPFVTGISGYIQGQVNILNSQTGQYVLTGSTGDFYPRSNPSGYITGVDLSGYVTGEVVRPSQTGDFITTGQTGDFYPKSNPSGFITGVDLSNYATIPYVTGISGDLNNKISNIASGTGQFYLASNPSGFITGVDLTPYATISFTTGISGSLQNQITTLNNQTGQYVLTGSTGSFITQSQTGQFYAASNPSGFITGVDLSNYATIGFTTGISGSLQQSISNLESHTGDYYPRTNPSGYITGIPNIVYTTGDQDISGLKDFQTRPTVTDIPVLLSGEAVDLVHLYGKNDEAQTIHRGQPVYIYGANGANPLIRVASNTGEGTSSKTIGLMAQDVLPNAFGFVVSEGMLEGFDTSSGQAGDAMWLGTTGDIIYGLANKPYGNNHLVYLGNVLRSSVNNGKVYVKVQNGFEIDELHKVYAKSPEDKHSLIYDSGSGAWFSRAIGTGDISGLNNYSTIAYVTGVSGSLQSQIVTADPVRTSLTGNGSVSSYSISGASGLVNPSALIVAIDGALQEPIVDYTVSGGQITFTSPLASGSKAVVVAPTNVLQVSQMIPADGSVTSSKLDSNIQIAGQLTNPNQTADTDYSVMNRSLADSRYGNILLAVKSGDTNRSNTTTFADDPHLSLNIPTTGLWEVSFFSFSTAADNTGGMKQQLAFSGTFNGPRSFIETRTSNQGVPFPAGSLTTLMRGGTAGAMTFPFQIVSATNRTVAGCLTMLLDVTTTGVLKIQWAQNASSATATTLVGGSYLKAKKVG